MTDNQLKEIIHGRTDLQIGRNGITPGVITQIKQRFEKNKYLKVRFLELAEFNTMKEAVEALCSAVNAVLVDSRGKTIVIQRLKQVS